MQASHASRGGCAQIWQFMVHVVFYIFDVICCPLRYLKQVKGPAAYQRTVAINTLTCLLQSVQGARCGEGLCEDGTDGLCRGVLWQHCQGRHPEVPSLSVLAQSYQSMHSHAQLLQQIPLLFMHAVCHFRWIDVSDLHPAGMSKASGQFRSCAMKSGGTRLCSLCGRRPPAGCRGQPPYPQAAMLSPPR